MQSVIRTDIVGKFLAVILAIIVAGIMLSQARCGNVCKPGTHQSGGQCVPNDDTDPGTCAVEPGEAIAKTLGITVCGDAPDTVSYGQSGTVLLEVNPNLDGRYTLQLETCASYDFRACGLGTSGETECVELTTTPEQLVNDSYDAELPNGCDGEEDDDTDPLDTPSVAARYADCINFTTATMDFNAAVLTCCAANEFASETDVGYIVGGTAVDCVEINATNP